MKASSLYKKKLWANIIGLTVQILSIEKKSNKEPKLYLCVSKSYPTSSIIRYIFYHMYIYFENSVTNRRLNTVLWSTSDHNVYRSQRLWIPNNTPTKTIYIYFAINSKTELSNIIILQGQ